MVYIVRPFWLPRQPIEGKGSHMKAATEYIPIQQQQDSVPLHISVDGSTNWRRFLDERIKFDLSDGDDKVWAYICGGVEVSLLTLLQKEAEVNGVSFERCVINRLLNRGYVLEELEFHAINAGPPLCEWGKCVWYKSHPSYETPLDVFWGETPQKWASFIRAIVKTERAGDQTRSLFSMQMFAASLIGRPRILLNKTFVFHRAVFISPKEESIAPAG